MGKKLKFIKNTLITPGSGVYESFSESMDLTEKIMLRSGKIIYMEKEIIKWALAPREQQVLYRWEPVINKLKFFIFFCDLFILIL